METKIRKKQQGPIKKLIAFLLLLVVFFMVLGTTLFTGISDKSLKSAIEKATNQVFEPQLPKKYIPLYQEAAEAYGIPWTLLAAHHRVETKFSNMDPLLSPVGAEGHLQFMPCTFVGWKHPTCTGLGNGEIAEREKVDPAIIQKYGGYGVDGDGDGVADPYNLTDALYSAANYLSQNGAADGELERAIFDYNRSEEYVKEVLFYYRKYEEQFRSK